MKRTFAAWVRTATGFVPFRVGTAVLIGAWLALTILFTLVGSALVLTVATALGQPLGLVALLGTVIGIFGAPAVSLTLSRVVVAGAVQRYEAVVRDVGQEPDSERFDSQGTSDRAHCQTSLACCC
jgi:hypothetical protein